MDQTRLSRLSFHRTALAAAAFVVALCAPTAFAAVCNVPTDHASIQAAVDDTACTQIIVAAGTYNEHVTIARDLMITGADAATTIVDGTNNGRVFTINSGTVTLSDLTVQHGLSPAGADGADCDSSDSCNQTGSGSPGENGGGILNAGQDMLTLARVVVRENRTGDGGDSGDIDCDSDIACITSGGFGGYGAGVWSTGPLTIKDSVVSDNITGNGGNAGNVSCAQTGSICLNDAGTGGSGGGFFTIGALILDGTSVNDNATGGGGAPGTVGNCGSGGFCNSASGNVGNSGGVGLSGSTADITNCTFSGNSAYDGGVIVQEGAVLTIKDSTFIGNSATNSGGAVNCNSGAQTCAISGSMFTENSVTGAFGGGAIAFFNGGTKTVTNCSITGNTTTKRAGGVLAFSGPVTLNFVTINGNTADVGGGVFGGGDPLTIKNSIISGNTAATSGNCDGTITDGGYNIENSNTCGFSTANNSQPNTDPLLDPKGLNDNGGPTLTVALQANSPAVDKANAAGDPTTDQRGVKRPIDFSARPNATGGDGSDIGAFEFQGTQSLVVTTSADEDKGTGDPSVGTGTSLREAINYANSLANPGTITFDIPGTGVRTIKLGSSLPEITKPVTIDGYTQPGASPNTNALTTGDNAVLTIQINGQNNNATDAFTFGAGSEGSVLRGVVVNRAKSGVTIGTGNITVAGCFLGTSANGLQALGNSLGVSAFIQGSGVVSASTVGGANPADRNLISGNDVGMAISAPGMVVRGNLIGTDATGLAAMSNGAAGIFNGGVGIINADNVQVRANVISGNNSSGLFVTNGAAGTIVQRNYIGVGVDGTTPLGNGKRGIYLFGAAPGHTIGDALNTNPTVLAGAAPANGKGNIIANNGMAGVTVTMAGGVICHQKSILGNSIYRNGGLGIDLDGGNNGNDDGVTPNDPGDADDGPNALQNFPVLTSVGQSGANVVIDGKLNSNPSTQYRVEFFHSFGADNSNHGEGRTYLGFQYVTTNSSGHAGFSTTLPFTGSGGVISATATDPVGNTSEFALGIALTSPTATRIQFSASVYPVNEAAGNAIVTVTRAGETNGSSTVHYQTANGTANSPADYKARSGILTFGPNQKSKTITIPIVDDNIDESNQYFAVLLKSPTNATLPPDSAATVRIVDDDPLPSVAFSPATYQLIERRGPVELTVKMTGKKATPARVHFTTSDGTAHAGTDYEATSGVIVFQPGGPDTQTIQIPILNNHTPESSESFTVTLSGTPSAKVGKPSEATVTINDYDGQPASDEPPVSTE